MPALEDIAEDEELLRQIGAAVLEDMGPQAEKELEYHAGAARELGDPQLGAQQGPPSDMTFSQAELAEPPADMTFGLAEVEAFNAAPADPATLTEEDLLAHELSAQMQHQAAPLDMEFSLAETGQVPARTGAAQPPPPLMPPPGGAVPPPPSRGAPPAMAAPAATGPGIPSGSPQMANQIGEERQWHREVPQPDVAPPGPVAGAGGARGPQTGEERLRAYQDAQMAKLQAEAAIGGEPGAQTQAPERMTDEQILEAVQRNVRGSRNPLSGLAGMLGDVLGGNQNNLNRRQAQEQRRMAQLAGAKMKDREFAQAEFERSQRAPEPIIQLMVKKGYVTPEEADSLTNEQAQGLKDIVRLGHSPEKIESDEARQVLGLQVKSIEGGRKRAFDKEEGAKDRGSRERIAETNAKARAKKALRRSGGGSGGLGARFNELYTKKYFLDQPLSPEEDLELNDLTLSGGSKVQSARNRAVRTGQAHLDDIVSQGNRISGQAKTSQRARQSTQALERAMDDMSREDVETAVKNMGFTAAFMEANEEDRPEMAALRTHVSNALANYINMISGKTSTNAEFRRLAGMMGIPADETALGILGDPTELFNYMKSIERLYTFVDIMNESIAEENARLRSMAGRNAAVLKRAGLGPKPKGAKRVGSRRVRRLPDGTVVREVKSAANGWVEVTSADNRSLHGR